MKLISRWHQIYNRPKKHDELVRYEDPKNKILKEIRKITPLKNKVILDLGAGTGRFTFLYAQSAKHVYAVDPSKAHIAFLKKKAKKQNVGNITIKLGRAEKIPLKKRSVDAVISTFAVSATAVDKQKTLCEMLRVLKPKGKIIIVDSYYESEFIDIWRRCSDTEIAGACYNNLLKIKDMYPFKIRLIDTFWGFPTVKKAAELFGYVIGGKTRQHLLKNRLKRIKITVYIAYGAG